MVDLYTDSTSDLHSEIIQQRKLNVLPLYVILDSKAYKDRTEISTKDIFNYVSQTGNLPKTSAIAQADFLSAFDSAGEKIFIGIGSKFSATINNAQIAAASLQNQEIFIIDSMSLSSGIALLVLLAADLRDQGYNLNEILTAVNHAIPKVRVSFMIETLDYLHKGGRCSALQNIFGSLLSIRPIIEVRQDGTMGIKTKMRASRSKTMDYLIDQFKNDLPQIDTRRVFITHTSSPEDIVYMQRKILEICQPGDIHISTAGSVIASHCGPGTIGLIYMLK